MKKKKLLNMFSGYLLTAVMLVNSVIPSAAMDLEPQNQQNNISAITLNHDAIIDTGNGTALSIEATKETITIEEEDETEETQTIKEEETEETQTIKEEETGETLITEEEGQTEKTSTTKEDKNEETSTTEEENETGKTPTTEEKNETEETPTTEEENETEETPTIGEENETEETPGAEEENETEETPGAEEEDENEETITTEEENETGTTPTTEEENKTEETPTTEEEDETEETITTEEEDETEETPTAEETPGAEEESGTENALKTTEISEHEAVSPYENWFYGNAEDQRNENVPYDRADFTYFDHIDMEELGYPWEDGIAEGIFVEVTDDIEVVIAMAEEGLDLYKFFYGTNLFGFDLEALYAVRDNGYSLADISECLIDKNYDDCPEWLSDIIAAIPSTLAAGDKMQIMPYSKISGYRVLGAPGFWRMNSTVGEVFCLQPGKSCARYSSYTQAGSYSEVQSLYENITYDQYLAIMAAVEYYGLSPQENSDHAAVQFFIWYALSHTIDGSTTAESVWNDGFSGTAAAIGGSMVQVTQWLQYYRARAGMEDVCANHIEPVLSFWIPDVGTTAQTLVSFGFEPAKPPTVEQKGDLRVSKVDQFDQPVADAVFRVRDAKWNVVATITTDENGVAEVKGLAVGRYYVGEIQAPQGYELDTTVYTVDVIANGTTPVTSKAVNKKIGPPVTIRKVDIETGDYIAGITTLQIYKEDGITLVSEFKVSGDAYVTYLAPGNYILREKTPAAGYLAAAAVPFTVADYDTPVTVTMEDDFTKLKIIKEDTVGNPLAGAKFWLWTTNAAGEKASVYARWTSTTEPQELKRIPVGTYILQEIEAPAGYMVAEDKVIKVPASTAIQTVTVQDDTRKISIFKIDSATDLALEDAHLELWTVDDNWNPVKKVDEWISDTAPHVLKGITETKYLLVETEAPAGYTNFGSVRLDLGHVHTAECYEVPAPAIVTASHDYGWGGSEYFYYCEACKEEIQYAQSDYMENGGEGDWSNWNNVYGTGVYVKCEQVYVEWQGGTQWYPNPLRDESGDYIYTTSGDPAGYEIKGVRGSDMQFLFNGSGNATGNIVGIHFNCTEAKVGSDKPVCGYQEAETDGNGAYVFTVGNDMETQVNRLSIRKLDAEVYTQVAGAEMEIWKVSGTTKVSKYLSFTTTDSAYDISGIPAGDYVLTETKAPTGYAKADDIYFTITDSIKKQTVTMYEDSIKVQFSKKDVTTKAELPGAHLAVYRADGNGNKTGTALYEWVSGLEPYEIDLFPAGSYILSETIAPEGYLKSMDVLFTVKETGEIQTVTMEDDYTRLTISKKDISTGDEIPGTVLEIWYADLSGNKTELYTTFVSSVEPHSFEKLPAGNYVLTEKTPADGYVTAQDIPFTVKETGEIQTVTMYDDYNKLEILKADKYSGKYLNGAVLQLYTTDENGERGYLYEEWTTDGTAHRIDRIPAGTYLLYEKTAPHSYAKAEAMTVTVPESAEVLTVTMEDEHQYGTVTLFKYDAEREDTVSQGDAAGMDGAVYGLYAAEPVVDSYGNTIYEAEELVETAVVGWSTVIDEEGYLLDEDGTRCIVSGKEPVMVSTPGKTNFQQLLIGSYYIQEIAAIEGYMPDMTVQHGTTLQKYSVTFTQRNSDERVILRDELASEADNTLTLDDALIYLDADDPDYDAFTGGLSDLNHAVYSGDYVMKQAAQFYKLKDLSTDSEKTGLEGAGFQIYLISDLTGVKDGSITPKGEAWTKEDIESFKEYDFSKEQTAIVYKHEETLDAWSDGDKAWLVPTGKDREYRTAEMFSDEDGYFITPELPYGQYILVETTTPEGKATADPLIVTISQDASRPQGIRFIGDETLELYVRIVKTDRDAVEGAYDSVLKAGAEYRIRLTSDASVFDSKFWMIDKEGYLYYYDPASAQEIGSKSAPFETTVIYENGAAVDAYVELPYMLPYGDYELTEVTAPEGFVLSGYEQALEDTSDNSHNDYEIRDIPGGTAAFSINRAALEVTIKDKYGHVIYTVSFEDQEQKGILELNKSGEKLHGASNAEGEVLSDKLPDKTEWNTDSTVRDYIFTYEDRPIAGAVFEIYAAEDIYTQQLDKTMLDSYGVDTGRYLVYEKDALVGTITTDEDGYAYLADLYIGKYYIRETQTTDGFLLSSDDKSFEITAQDQEVNFDWSNLSWKNERQKVSVTVTKLDKDTQAPLAGMVCGLYAAEDIYNCDGGLLVSAGTLVATAVSGADGKAVFDEDLPLGRYDIRELEAPDGYTVSNEKIRVDAGYTGQNGDSTIELAYDMRNAVTKTDFDKQDLTNGESIAGARVTVLEEASGKVIDSWVSDGEAHRIEGLLLSNAGEHVYMFRETKPADGYTTAEDIRFKLYQDTDAAGGWLDSYTVYIYAEDAWQALDGVTVAMKDDYTVAKITKSDLVTGEPVIGAHLEIRDEDGNTVASWITTKEPHYIEKLPVGRYTLIETQAPDGYLIAEEIEFEVVDKLGYHTEDGSGGYTVNETEVIKADMKDDFTVVKILKTDIHDGSPLDGAHFEIRNEENEIAASWISTKEPYYIERLPIGRYILIETESPFDYLLAEPIVFEVTAEGDYHILDANGNYVVNEEAVITVEMQDTPGEILVEKSTIDVTQGKDIFKYTIDTIWNHYETETEHFTLIDTLPAEVHLTELYTGTFHEDLTFTVLYKTNKNSRWQVWKEALSTLTCNKLSVSDLALSEGEYVTSFELYFGTVPGQFKNAEAPYYFVEAAEYGDGLLDNIAELTGYRRGELYYDQDKTTTRVYRKSISGYGPGEEGSPSYIITGKEISQEDYFRNKWPLHSGKLPTTGDDSSIFFYAALLLAAGSIAVWLLSIYIRRKKSGKVD